MADNRRQIELALEVTTANAESINRLREDVKELAKQGELAGPAFKDLDRALGQLADQARQLDAINELAPALNAARASQNQLADASAALGAQVQELAAKTRSARDEQDRINLEYKQAVNAYQESQQALRAFKGELALADQKTLEHKQTLRDLNQAVLDAQKTKNAYKIEVEQAAQAVKQASAAQAEAGKAFNASKSAVSAATKELNGLERQTSTASQKFIEAGGATGALADQQQGLQNALMQTKAEIQRTVAISDALAASDRQQALEAALAASASKRAYEQMSAAARAEADGIVADFNRMKQAQRDAALAAQAAGNAIREAFRTVGGRGAAEIRDEIERIRQAMNLLAQSGALTSRELNLAMKQGAASIKLLERDLREATGTMTLMDKAAGLLQSSIGQLAAFMSLQEAVQRTGTAFYEATKSIQAMQLGLTSIYGSADTAKQQIGFLRDTANRAGVSVADLSATFTKFSASTKESNIPLEQSNALFAELVRVSGLLGLSGAKSQQALEAISQMAAKGTVSLEELRQQLGDAIPGATALAAKGLGLTQEELYKLVESGNLTARQFIPAFTEALRTLAGENTTLQGAVARVSNAITTFFQQASDSTAVQALTAGLNALATNFGTVVDATYGLGKALLGLKLLEYVRNLSLFGGASQQAAAGIATQTAATTANTVATTANTTALATNTAAKRANAIAGAEVGVAATGAAQKLTAMGVVAGVTTGALNLLGAAGRAVFTMLGGWPMLLVAVATNLESLGTWLGETAAKMMGWGRVMDENTHKLEEQRKKGEELLAAKQQEAQKNEQLMTREVQKLLETRQAVDARTAADEKATEAAVKQGTALEKLSAMRGDEAGKLQAATQASTLHLAAAEREASSKAALVQALEIEVASRRTLIDTYGKNSQKMQEELQKTQELLAQKRAEADTSAAVAQALRYEVAEREVAAQAYQNNADKVDQYRRTLDDTNRTLAGVLAMEKQGLPVAQAVERARIAQAKAEALYRDALSDRTRQMTLANEAAKAEAQVGLASLQLRKAELTNVLEAAKARGDWNAAHRATIALKELEIEIQQAQIKMQLAEQQGIIELAKAKLEELKRRGENTAEQQKELEIAIRLAEAKMIEIKARGQNVEALQRELEALKYNTTATHANREASDSVRGAKDSEAGARFKNVDAIQAENDKLAAQNNLRKISANGEYLDKDGMVTDARGNRITTESATWTSVFNYVKGLGITDEQARSIADRGFDSLGRSTGGLQQSELRSTYESIDIYEAARRKTERILREQPAPVKDTTTANKTPSSTPVTINLNGTSTRVNVASGADATALTQLLNQLQSGAARAL